jgi:hypothetical protein
MWAMGVDSSTELGSPRRTRLWRRVCLGVGLLVLLVTGVYVYHLLSGGSELRAALAEADELDPGWRLEELDAQRPGVPDAENGALQLLIAHAQLRSPWPIAVVQFSPSRPGFGQILPATPPPDLLTPAQVSILREALEGAELALPEARKLAAMPRGRYSPCPTVPCAFPNYQRSCEAYLKRAQQIVKLLALDAVQRCQEQDADDALASCRGIMNIGRWCGDLPLRGGPLAQADFRGWACCCLERALAQGEAFPAALIACQQLLEEDEPVPLFLKGARVCRAETDAMLDPERSWPGNRLRSSLIATASLGSRAAVLRAHTQIVEIAKLPAEEQEQQFKEQGLPPKSKLPFFARNYLLPRTERVVTALIHDQKSSRADMRCAIAALAAERYRRAKGIWPASLSNLVPDYLSEIPSDPFDGKLLRLRRLDDGVVIYSVGLDGQDNGGTIDRLKPDAQGTDRGFRLWDLPRRRQTPKAAAK